MKKIGLLFLFVCFWLSSPCYPASVTRILEKLKASAVFEKPSNREQAEWLIGEWVIGAQYVSSVSSNDNKGCNMESINVIFVKPTGIAVDQTNSGSLRLACDIFRIGQWESGCVSNYYFVMTNRSCFELPMSNQRVIMRTEKAKKPAWLILQNIDSESYSVFYKRTNGMSY